jgi:hypothetical protein
MAAELITRALTKAPPVLAAGARKLRVFDTRLRGFIMEVGARSRQAGYPELLQMEVGTLGIADTTRLPSPAQLKRCLGRFKATFLRSANISAASLVKYRAAFPGGSTASQLSLTNRQWGFLSRRDPVCVFAVGAAGRRRPSTA